MRKPALALRALQLSSEPPIPSAVGARREKVRLQVSHQAYIQKRDLLQCLTQEVKNPQEKRDHAFAGFIVFVLVCFASIFGAPRLSRWYIDATAAGSIYTLLCYEFGVGVTPKGRKGRSEMPSSFLPLSPDYCFLKFPFHCAGFPRRFERSRE